MATLTHTNMHSRIYAHSHIITSGSASSTGYMTVDAKDVTEHVESGKQERTTAW
jgi:hypothetical protein